jgi:hypothetical protein
VQLRHEYRLAAVPDSRDPTLGLPLKVAFLLSSAGQFRYQRAVISSIRPAPALRHFIKYYYQVEATLSSTLVLQPVPARSPEIIEFMVATPYVVERLYRGTAEQCSASALVGPKTHRHVNLFMHDRVDAFTITFQPGGFFALFGIPSNTLTDQDFDARDVLGPDIAALRNRRFAHTVFSDCSL